MKRSEYLQLVAQADPEFESMLLCLSKKMLTFPTFLKQVALHLFVYCPLHVQQSPVGEETKTQLRNLDKGGILMWDDEYEKV